MAQWLAKRPLVTDSRICPKDIACREFGAAPGASEPQNAPLYFHLTCAPSCLRFQEAGEFRLASTYELHSFPSSRNILFTQVTQASTVIFPHPPTTLPDRRRKSASTLQPLSTSPPVVSGLVFAAFLHRFLHCILIHISNAVLLWPSLSSDHLPLVPKLAPLTNLRKGSQQVCQPSLTS